MPSITRYIGDDYSSKLYIKKSGVAVDITDCVITLYVYSSSEDLFELDAFITNAESGEAELRYTTLHVQDAGTYKFKIKVTYPSGKTKTIQKGTFIIED